MQKPIRGLGIIFIIGGLIIGFVVATLTREFNLVAFIISCASGVITGFLFLGFAQLLDTVDSINYHLAEQASQAAKVVRENTIGAKKKCRSCDKEYDSDRNSCPNCGAK